MIAKLIWPLLVLVLLKRLFDQIDDRLERGVTSIFRTSQHHTERSRGMGSTT